MHIDITRYKPSIVQASLGICGWITTLTRSNASLHSRNAHSYERAIEFESWPHFYQARSAWSMHQGSNENHSPVNNFAPSVTKFCVLWKGQALPHDTKFGNCRDKIVDSRAFLSWSLIHGSSWSGLIKLGPGLTTGRLVSFRFEITSSCQNTLKIK